ncbi:ILEUB inhibitor, partial [Polypterus senegalus]
MMHQKSKFKFAFIPEMQCQVLELPYVENELSMLILLPKDIEDNSTGLEKLEKSLTLEKLHDWTNPDNMEKIEINVSLPRFKLERSYDLKEVLIKMGVVDAFDMGRADLSGMSPKDDLFLSKAVHKSFVEVNEEGTEAAAATAMVVMMRFMASLCSAISQFSLDLFKNLSEKQASNIFYSPLSISSALAMVCMGARGNTAAEIMKSLHVQKAGDDVHSYFSSLITDINKPGASYQLSLANRLYGEKSFEFLKEFIGKTTTFYHASLEAVDFIQAPEASRKNINAWVEKQTNGDDDIFVYPPAIVNYLKRTPDVTSYIHGNIRVHTDVLRGGKYKISYHLYSMNVLPTFVSGAGFIIPGILIPPLYHAATVLPIFPLDDVYFGFLAIKANVTLKHGHGFYCWGVRFDACKYQNAVFVHSLFEYDEKGMSPEQLLDVWGKVIKQENCIEV